MRFFLISDNIDTAIGLRLAGVVGTVVHGREETLKAFKKVIEDETIGILLVTELAAKEISEEIKLHKISGKLPLVFVIPDRHGWRGDRNFITRYVEEVVGVKLNE